MILIPKFKSRNFQVKILKEFLTPNFRGAVSAGRGLGKDFIGLACADALALMKPGSNLAYLGLSLKSVKKILMANDDKTGIPMYKNILHLEAMVKTRNGDFFHKELSCFKYKNGSMIFILGTDQDQELGTSLDGLIITESARFAFDKWLFLKGNINRANGRILQISTPYFGSEFNDLIDGTHHESGSWNTYKVPASEARNADGSLVYSKQELARIRQEFDDASFRQEYEVDTTSINKDSVLGNSLEKSLRTKVKFDGNSRKLFFSFDLGNSDNTVMYVYYIDDYMRVPVMINQMIQNRTNLSEFIEKAKQTAIDLKMRETEEVVVILPFDSDNDLQGYSGKINRKKEIEKNIPDFWSIRLITKMNTIRLIQVCRRVIETHKLGIIDNYDGDTIIRGLASVNYKREVKTGKLLMEVDKRSGIHGDHALDSLKYFCAFYFKNMYDEDYDKKLVKSLVPNRLSTFNESKFGNSSW